jgi:hypothetical protein
MYCYPGGLRLNSPMFNFPSETNQVIPRESFRLADGLNWIHGRHNARFGLDLRQVRDNFFTDSGINGSPTISGQDTGNVVGDMLLGFVASDSRGYYTALNLRGFFQSYYAQDDIRVSRRLTLNIGLRWDPYTPWYDKWNKLVIFSLPDYYAGVHSTRFPKAPAGLLYASDPGVPPSTIPNDYRMLAPRFGFAANPFGNGRTAIRGGYGIFFDQQVEPVLLLRQKNNAPFNITEAFSFGSQFADPLKGKPDPFATLVAQPGQFGSTPGGNYLNPNFKPAYIQQWNLTVEQQFQGNQLVRISYVGTKGTRMESTRGINNPVYIPGNSTIANTESRRPLIGVGNVRLNDSDGNSIYQALQVNFERRYSRHLQFKANYTWARAIDEGSATLEGSDCCGADVPQDANNLHNNRGLSDFDVAHKFQAYGIWDAPSPHVQSPVASALLKGWELSPIVTMQTGVPLNIITGQDRSFTAQNFDRPDVLRSPVLPGDRPMAARIASWFDPTALVLNQVGQFGSLGRNALRGPGFANVDGGLYKNFRWKESRNLQVRWEMFNALNHTKLSNPNLSWGTSLGRIFSDRGPRIMQLSLKLQY